MPTPVGKVLDRNEIEKLARETLNEKPDQVQEDIDAIRKWMKQQPHLKKFGNTGNSQIKTVLPNYFNTFTATCIKFVYHFKMF